MSRGLRYENPFNECDKTGADDDAADVTGEELYWDGAKEVERMHNSGLDIRDLVDNPSYRPTHGVTEGPVGNENKVDPAGVHRGRK